MSKRFIWFIAVMGLAALSCRAAGLGAVTNTPRPTLITPKPIEATGTQGATEPSSTIVTETSPPVEPTSSVTAAATNTSPPPAETTQAPPPQGTSPAEPQRISFSTGATTAQVNGDLAQNETDRYVLRIQAGQVLEAGLTEGQFQLSIHGADGSVLRSPDQAGTYFRGLIPTDQDYVIEIKNLGAAAGYTLSLAVPARIQFESGATSEIVEGKIPALGGQYYSLRLQEGQLLDISVTPMEGIQLMIYTVNGTVIKSGSSGGAFFRSTVPATTEYILLLTAGDQSPNFTMNILVPERINFEPGAVSAVREGDLEPFKSHTYILRAMEGQTMTITLFPPGDVRLVVYGVDGTVLQSGMGELSNFSGRIPITQDYLLTVDSSTQPAYYVLEVEIQ